MNASIPSDTTKNMNNRYAGYLISAIIAVTTSFLIFYFWARKFARHGSLINQGYVGNNGKINLSNVAVGALTLLIITIVASYIIDKKPTKETKIMRKVGITVLIVAGIWFLLVAVAVAYLLLNGRIFEGWDF